MAWLASPFQSSGALGTLQTVSTPWGPITLANSGPSASTGALPVVTITPVAPTFDPKFDANALYGKPKLLFAGGLARIGAAPAPLLMPWIRNGLVNFVVWICYPVPIDGTRVLFDIALDNEIAWRANDQVAGGTEPSHGTFSSEPFDFTFTQGTMTQGYVPEEHRLFPGDENAYRPACVLEIRNLIYDRYMKLSGRPVPYVAPLIGDTTDGANPHDGINLGTAMERIAYSPWCRRTSDNYETVGITDRVGAVLIKENFNIVQIGQAITQAYPNIDQITSDKIRLKDRGNVVYPDIFLNADNVIASSSIVISRSAPSEQARQEELLTIEAEQDYTIGSSLSQRPRDPFPVSAAVGRNTTTLPVVMDAPTRQALVIFKQHANEVARKRMRLTATGDAYRVMPGDLAAVTGMMSGMSNEVMKVLEATHGANLRVEMILEAILRCNNEVPTPTHAFHAYASDSSDLTEYTFAPLPIGDAAPDRHVIVGVVGSAQTRTVAAVTVGGIAATLVKRRTATYDETPSSVTAELWIAAVPTGATADTVVTWTGEQSRCAVGIWSATGLSSATPVDTDGGNVNLSSNPSFITLNSLPGGICIAMGTHHATADGSIDWAGAITEDFFDNFGDVLTFTFGGASATTVGSSVTLAPFVGAEFNGNSPFVAATFA